MEVKAPPMVLCSSATIQTSNQVKSIKTPALMDQMCVGALISTGVEK